MNAGADLQRAGVMVQFESVDGTPDYRAWVKDAIRIGSFHVHRTVYGNHQTQDVGGEYYGFTLTHSLTGIAVARHVPSAEAACELAAFMEALQINWRSTDYKAIRASAGPLLRTDIRARVTACGGRL